MQFAGDFRIARILEMKHPWEAYLKHVLTAKTGNKLLQEQLLLKRPEFLIDEEDFVGKAKK